MSAAPAKSSPSSKAATPPPPSENMLRKVFDTFDADGSGEVDVVEMATQAMVLGFYVKSHGHI